MNKLLPVIPVCLVLTACGGGSNSDKTAPVVTANTSHIVLKVNESIILPSYTAIDDVDGDISDVVEISTLPDTSIAGSYQIKLTATDSSSNTSVALIDIEVIEADYRLSFNDKDLTLMESNYSHRFHFLMDDTQPFVRNMSISVSDLSTATEGDDFRLAVKNFTIEAYEAEGFIDIEVKDDVLLERNEKIVLTFINNDNEQSYDYTINLDDRSVGPKAQDDMYLSPFSPNAEILNDELIVLSRRSIERRMLTTFSAANGTDSYSTKATGEDYSFIKTTKDYYDESYSDSFVYDQEIYLISDNQLLWFNRELNSYSLLSESPYLMGWASQVTVIGSKAYFIGSGGFPVSSSKSQTYDFASGSWGVIAEFPSAGSTSTVSIDNELYAFTRLYSFKYDSDNDAWIELAPHWTNDSFTKAYTVGKKVYLPNYNRSGLIAKTPVDIYDSELNAWYSLDIDTPQKKYKDLATYKGFIYLIGGKEESLGEDSSDITKYYIGDDLTFISAK